MYSLEGKESTMVTTRGRKRKIGRRDSLWDLIVNNDDICFKHILPRLNGTDLKFLHGVNGETRKLIKRSSRKKELKERFKVNEMSSISTLEVAWEHYPWGTLVRRTCPRRDETYFCEQVAWTNKLELLEWAREEKKCEWDRKTICAAANHGNMEMVKYCVANECPIDVSACAHAAEGGHLECLKYLREEVKAPWDWRTASWAAKMVTFIYSNILLSVSLINMSNDACWFAAVNGHLDCLKYLHETAKAPWNLLAVRGAHENNHPDCLQYLLDNNCPLPHGWRYEHGELHTP